MKRHPIDTNKVSKRVKSFRIFCRRTAACKEWNIYQWWTSTDSGVCRARAVLTAASRRLPWRPRWPATRPRQPRQRPPGGRTAPRRPCSPTPPTPPRLRCAVQARSSPSGPHPPLLGTGSSCRLPPTALRPKTAPSPRTAGGATRMDTSSPAPPATPRTMTKTAEGSLPPASLRPAPPPPARLTATTTTTSTATTTATTTATPLSATPQHPRTDSDGGTAGDTSGACYRWWTWNSSLGDAARDDRLAGDAFIAGDSDRFSRVHLYYGRGSFMTRVWGSTTPNSPSCRALPLPRAARETAKRGTWVRKGRTHAEERRAGTLSVSLIPTCVAYIRKR